jgi:phenylacetate-coenzyme A ligase PaaK-like adenylate-forming protein
MVSQLLSSLYIHFPLPLQRAACWYYGWTEKHTRFGRRFEYYLERLTETDRWNRGSIEAYQDEALRNLIEHVYHNVPLYRERMDAHRLTPSDFRTREDLVKMPVLTKDDIRFNRDKLLARGSRKNHLQLRATSGTSASSLHLYYSWEAVQFQWAVWWRHRRRFGVDFGTPHANFTSKPVVPLNQDRPPYWRWISPLSQLAVNMQHMVPDKVAAICHYLDECSFSFYSGYPSVLHSFAATALENGIKLQNTPKFVFFGAENMNDLQRRDLRALTGAIISDQYGMAEGCGNVSQCEHLRHHEDFEFGIVECAEPNVVEDGVSGSILCTGFANLDFPLIRYAVGDTATWAREGTRCDCGRESRIINRIDGRIDDYVLTPEGRRIMRFGFLFHGMDMIRECQIVQTNVEAITLRVMRRPGYTAKHEAEMTDRIRQCVSPTIMVQFEYPAEIERTRGGKFRAVVSMVPGCQINTKQASATLLHKARH